MTFIRFMTQLKNTYSKSTVNKDLSTTLVQVQSFLIGPNGCRLIKLVKLKVRFARWLSYGLSLKSRSTCN